MISGGSLVEVHHLILIFLVFYVIELKQIDPKELYKELHVYLQKPITFFDKIVLVRSSNQKAPI